jgi:phosphatidylglycerophosphate synthase
MTEIPPFLTTHVRPRQQVRHVSLRLGMPPGRTLKGFHLCAMGGLLIVLAIILGPLEGSGALAQFLPLASYGLLVVMARIGIGRDYPHPSFGACNAVTYFRASGVAALSSVLALAGPPIGGWLVPAVAAVILAADGIDGWLARRANRCSDFGARFDMETDAALALLLAALIWQTGLAGPWVLWLGLARYGFILAGWVLPWMREPLPPSFRRKAGCVVQIGALVLALVPGLPALAVQAALVAAAAVLMWSFGADIAWLRRNRPARKTHATAGKVAGQRAVTIRDRAA